MPRHKLTPQERRTILDAVDSAIEHGAAVAEETGSLKKGVAAVQERIAAFVEEAAASGISRTALGDYLGELALTLPELKTGIALLRNHVVRVTVRADRSRFTPESGPRRLHAGGNLRPDEELIVGQAGERVLSRRQWGALRAEYNKPRRRLTRWLKRRWKR